MKALAHVFLFEEVPEHKYSQRYLLAWCTKLFCLNIIFGLQKVALRQLKTVQSRRFKFTSPQDKQNTTSTICHVSHTVNHFSSSPTGRSFCSDEGFAAMSNWSLFVPDGLPVSFVQKGTLSCLTSQYTGSKSKLVSSSTQLYQHFLSGKIRLQC